MTDDTLATAAEQPALVNSLWPDQAMEQMGRVLRYGAKKHGPDTWRNNSLARTRSLSLNAAVSHINEYLSGDKADSESGQNPLAHAIVRLMFVLEKEIEEGQS